MQSRKLTGGVSLDGDLLFRFFRVPTREGGVSSYLCSFAVYITLLQETFLKIKISFTFFFFFF